MNEAIMADHADNPNSSMSSSPPSGDDAPGLTDFIKNSTNDTMSHPITAPPTSHDTMTSEACHSFQHIRDLINNSKKHCADLEAKVKQMVAKRQAGLDLIAQGMQKLVDVENECLKLSNSVKDSAGSASSTTLAQDLTGLSIDALANSKAFPSDQGHEDPESSIKTSQEQLAAVQDELKVKDAALSDMQDKHRKATEQIDILTCELRDKSRLKAQADLVSARQDTAEPNNPDQVEQEEAAIREELQASLDRSIGRLRRSHYEEMAAALRSV
jgi:fructose-1,6-bisphosphatase